MAGRGKPHVSTAPIRIEQFGFSPEQMSLKDLRRLPEERISALLGIPAIVAGLGAGLGPLFARGYPCMDAGWRKAGQGCA